MLLVGPIYFFLRGIELEGLNVYYVLLLKYYKIMSSIVNALSVYNTRREKNI
jgi:hypothetical protein